MSNETTVRLTSRITVLSMGPRDNVAKPAATGTTTPTMAETIKRPGGACMVHLQQAKLCRNRPAAGSAAAVVSDLLPKHSTAALSRPPRRRRHVVLTVAALAYVVVPAAIAFQKAGGEG
jgi:hypothetical protein